MILTYLEFNFKGSKPLLINKIHFIPMLLNSYKASAVLIS